MARVIGDTAHPITLVIGRGLSGAIVDNFGTNEVDVGDLEKFPGGARDEAIVHFMVERNNRANTGNPNFDPAHQAGIDAQNQMRAERGQAPVTSQAYAGRDVDGNVIGRTTYADGTHQDAHIDPNGNVVSVTPP